MSSLVKRFTLVILLLVGWTGTCLAQVDKQRHFATAEEAAAALAALPGVSAIALFGSVARGSSDDGSLPRSIESFLAGIAFKVSVRVRHTLFDVTLGRFFTDFFEMFIRIEFRF